MTEPIEVKDNLTSEITWQTARVVLIFVAGWAVNHWSGSETVTAAGIAAATALLTYGYGVWKKVREHKLKLSLASLLPDSKAVVK